MASSLMHRWRNRRVISGRHSKIEVKRWWSPSRRRDARADALLHDFAYAEAREAARRDRRARESTSRKYFAPDEWA